MRMIAQAIKSTAWGKYSVFNYSDTEGSAEYFKMINFHVSAFN